MLARYHSPALGRFLSVDPGFDVRPAEPKSWNLYGYVQNNPVHATDPTGSVRHFSDSFTKRLHADPVFREAYKGWLGTESGREQWNAMRDDANTTYLLDVGPVEWAGKPVNGKTTPNPEVAHRGGDGLLDHPEVKSIINPDLIQKTKPGPAEAAKGIALAIFEEAYHALDLGAGRATAGFARDADDEQCNTDAARKMEEAMKKFEEEWDEQK